MASTEIQCAGSDIRPRIDQLVQQQIATGRFQTADEVLVEALETLRDMEHFAEPIRDELRRRLSRGNEARSLPLDRAAFRAEARRRLAADEP
ncbi:MAG: ribbon-helix-helix domain-containing protein [Candidatus Saccharimonadales bacterium]